MAEHDVSFRCMGSDVRLLLGSSLDPRGDDPAAAAKASERWLRQFAARLSRFRPDSELSVMNADPRSVVPASALLRSAVRAGLWAAERTGGLVDPTLGRAVCEVGYVSSREGQAPVALPEGLAQAPVRRPASAHPAAGWRLVSVDDEAGTVSRPPGLHIDTGGTGKGLAADALAHRLGPRTRAAIDCGGDIRCTGVGLALQPFVVEVRHPLSGGCARVLRLTGGAVATSGIDVNLWRDAHGRIVHHLLDPVSGRPAWTGLIAVTAIAPSALEAETLAKAALLSGPRRGPEWLTEHGGVLIHDSGEVAVIAGAGGRSVSVSAPVWDAA